MAATLRTDVGKVRRQNEDSAWFDEERRIFAVADGMGGHQAGEVASALAIDAIRMMARGSDMPGIGAMREAVAMAHESIVRRARSNPKCAGMGTTLSALWHVGSYAYIAHVGDSRIYRQREGRLEQITQDHSLVEEMVRAGLITKEEARVHPRRNVITRALGAGGENAPDLLAVDVRRGDLFMLCSDGLTGMVDDGEIAHVLTTYPIREAGDRLLELALEAGGKDNVTLVLYRYEGD